MPEKGYGMVRKTWNLKPWNRTPWVEILPVFITSGPSGRLRDLHGVQVNGKMRGDNVKAPSAIISSSWWRPSTDVPHSAQKQELCILVLYILFGAKNSFIMQIITSYFFCLVVHICKYSSSRNVIGSLWPSLLCEASFLCPRIPSLLSLPPK